MSEPQAGQAGRGGGRFRFGGFVITRPIPRPEGLLPELLPDELITVSPHFAPLVPDDWLIEWVQLTDDQRKRSAARLELDAPATAALTAWVTHNLAEGGVGWPNVILRRELVDEAMRLLPSGPWLALELGLAEAYVAELLASSAPSPGIEAGGVYQALQRSVEIDGGDQVLGFELLCCNMGTFDCSWLCGSLPQTCWRELGVRPGRFGLLEHRADAERAAQLIAEPSVGAEPGLWLPWRLRRIA